MRVLVACEFSGVVREAFLARGHEAWSCDLLPAEDDSPYHYRGDVKDILVAKGDWPEEPWDLMIAFPPCTHLAVSGARWFKHKKEEQKDAIAFFRELCITKIPRIAIENPIGIMSTHYRKPDQIIQPWQFGHGETKATCLWLKNLPPLTHTHTWWRAGKLVSIVWHRHRSAARNAVAPIKASPRRWLNSGEG